MKSVSEILDAAQVDVSGWPVRGVEQVGSTQNLWLEEPSSGEEWLHKDTVIPSNGIEQGEDWSEVVSTQVAMRLGVPCARTRLCVREGRRGSISLSVLPDGHALNAGSVVLERAGVPDFVSHVEGRRGVDPDRPEVRRPGYSLGNIRDALVGVEPPPGFRSPGAWLTGFDVFAGNLVLDALIANQDRHEQNWSVLTPQLASLPERLAPSYDHASSLGFNLTENRRRRIVQEPGRLRAWAEKGTAGKFEHTAQPPTLVQHAADAVAMCTPDGAHWWQDRIANVDLEPVLEALREGSVAGMSDLAATFAHDLLELNLRRLRNAL